MSVSTPSQISTSNNNIVIQLIFRTLCSHYGLLDLQERFVSYLPLSHVAANIMDIFMATQCLGTVYFANRDALKGTLVATLKEALPTVFFGVPRVWEKVQEKMIQVIKKKTQKILKRVQVGKANTGFKKAFGSWAKKTGLEYNKAKLGGRNGAKLSFKIADKMVFSKVAVANFFQVEFDAPQVKEELGFGHTHSFFSAAAPISRDVLDYFMSLDIKVLFHNIIL